jgi:exosortase family protein XrtM
MDQPTSRASFLTMSLCFLGLFCLLSVGWQFSKGTQMESLVIDRATVQPSVALINGIQDRVKVQADAHRIVSDKARLSVLNGCEGTEMLFLIVAAVLAFRCSLKAKLLGLLGGVVLVFVLNQVRIVALFFALLHDPELFDLIHGFVGPTIIVFFCALFYLYWTRWAQARARRAA